MKQGKVYIIGAGPGDPELMTLKGDRILRQADLILYAASLVNEEILGHAKEGARIIASSDLHLEQIVQMMVEATQGGQVVARVHSGDPSVYGAILEQMAWLRQYEVPFEVIPGVSSVFAAAAAIGAELTVPKVSQTVILTRTSGRASTMPEGEQLRDLAQHGATLAIFLSASLTGKVIEELRLAGLPEETPIIVVERVTWPDQRILRTCLADLQRDVREAGIFRQALILVGKVFNDDMTAQSVNPSRLYDKTYSHLFRRGVGGDG